MTRPRNRRNGRDARSAKSNGGSNGGDRSNSGPGLALVRPDGTSIDLGSLTDQVFSFQDADGWQYHWSVAEARKRALAGGTPPLTLSLSGTGLTVADLFRLYPGLDAAHALTRDLARPLLFVPLDDGEGEAGEGTGEAVPPRCVLIDGWHRTLKALLMGVDVLPCYVLSREDADASRILALPPGMGLSEAIFGLAPR